MANTAPHKNMINLAVNAGVQNKISQGKPYTPAQVQQLRQEVTARYNALSNRGGLPRQSGD